MDINKYNDHQGQPWTINEAEFIQVVKDAFQALEFWYIQDYAKTNGHTTFDSDTIITRLAKYKAIKATIIDMIETEMYKDEIKKAEAKE